MSKKIQAWTIVGFVVVVLIFVKQFFNQRFTSVGDVQAYMQSFGIVAPLILTVFQAFQVSCEKNLMKESAR